VAAITWELLTGTPPFGTGLRAIPRLMSKQKPVLPDRVRSHPQFGALAREIGDIICSCLEYEPNQRPTAAALASRCDAVCYLPPVREVGTVNNYPASSFGFIKSDDGAKVFFHVRNVVFDGPRPPVGTRVWFTKFDGQPAPRAIPVVPMKIADPAK
jgi:cold shock CspA family protein